MGKPLMKNWVAPDGTEYEVCDPVARENIHNLVMGVAEVTEDGSLVINVPEGTAIKTGTQICYREPSVIGSVWAEISSNHATINGKQYFFVTADNRNIDVKDLHEKNDTIIIRIDETIGEPLFAQVIAAVPKEQDTVEVTAESIKDALGYAPANKAVLYDQEQGLSDSEKEQARKNIGAAAAPVLTDEEILMSADGLILTHDNGLISLGTWTSTSTDTPFIDSSGAKMCTRKIKTSKLPQRVSGPTPWQYTFWKYGVNLGTQLTYADAQAAGFVTDLDFDEVAVNYGYGNKDGVTVGFMLPTQSSSGFSKVLVMGDSCSTDYYGSYTKWVTMLMDDGIFPATNTTNDSIHATGFVARYNNEANDFLTRIEAITDKSSYDLVVVFGGINDFIQAIPMGGGDGETDTATYFKPAVDYFFDYLVNNFTQARIVILSPLRTYHPYPNTSGFAQSEYTAYIREKAKSYCLPVLNLSEESGFIPFNDTFKNMWTFTGWSGGDGTTGDGVHPSEEYIRKFLAPMIKGFLLGIKPN